MLNTNYTAITLIFFLSNGPEWQEITTSESRQSSRIISSVARLVQPHLDKADGNTYSSREQSDDAQIMKIQSSAIINDFIGRRHIKLIVTRK